MLLQWGHDREVVEISYTVGDGEVYMKLQWGHDCEVVEIRLGPLVGAVRRLASMGPRP